MTDRCPNYDCDREVTDTERIDRYGGRAICVSDIDGCVKANINNLGADGTVAYLTVYHHDD